MCSPAITVHTSFRFTRPHRRTICTQSSVQIHAPQEEATICTQSSVQIHAPQEEGHDLHSVERSDSRAPRRGPRSALSRAFRFTRPKKRATICTQSSVQIHAPQEEGHDLHSVERSDSRAPRRGPRSALSRAFRFTRPKKRATICTQSSVQIHAPQEEGHDLHSVERSDSRAPRRGPRSALSRAFRFTHPKKRGTICTVVPADYAAASLRGQHSPTGFRFTWSKNRPRSAVRSRSVYPFSGHLRVREFGAADTNTP